MFMIKITVEEIHMDTDISQTYFIEMGYEENTHSYYIIFNFVDIFLFAWMP